MGARTSRVKKDVASQFVSALLAENFNKVRTIAEYELLSNGKLLNLAIKTGRINGLRFLLEKCSKK